MGSCLRDSERGATPAMGLDSRPFAGCPDINSVSAFHAVAVCGGPPEKGLRRRRRLPRRWKEAPAFTERENRSAP